MNNLLMYCISLDPRHLHLIKDINYIPVGLGDLEFNDQWINDKYANRNDISHKNKHYGEYTFHYKIWKNNFLPDDKWIGFCQYRKFWVKEKINIENLSFSQFKSKIIQKIPAEFDKYDSILGEELYVNQFKLFKFIKKGFKKIIFKPSFLFNENLRTIKFHFDLMHGDGNLDKAISVLDIDERNDFNEYVNTKLSFNPHNMFIVKKKEILYNYYNSLFPWLERCEKVFANVKLQGYGLLRLYGFLAERYMSYWFKKYTKYYLMKIVFKDISEYID